ncbi:hypothetical protein BN1051_02821 [Arthrobacter saudimassiliensis]|uniref:Uncharacterized protein n=1 Tax=Arthrobacter saudimassiliensis TaxID=1461584 RepID=A0A078MXA1_9MICC|nr:hypothetical protein BN1051_02821 [Arthrobacter saudimassiliensis]
MTKRGSGRTDKEQAVLFDASALSADASPAVGSGPEPAASDALNPDTVSAVFRAWPEDAGGEADGTSGGIRAVRGAVGSDCGDGAGTPEGLSGELSLHAPESLDSAEAVATLE